MASNEVVPSGDAELADIGLTDRQIQALDNLTKLNAEPAPPGGPYHSNPQIRAHQLVFEGKFGMAGPGRGYKRDERAAKVIADEVRDRLAPKMLRAIDRGLNKKAGHRINLDAVKLALDIENREASLRLKEEEADALENQGKDELIATLYALVQDPQTQAILSDTIEGQATEVIRDAEVVGESEAAVQNGRYSAGAEENGSDTPGTGINGRGSNKRNRPASENPFSQAKVRRPVNGQ
jgi:hypothetical protein